MNKSRTTGAEKSETKDFPFKAVIFDMDGTLIESTEADYLAWKKLFEDYDRELSFENYFPLLGMKSASVVEDHLELKDEQANLALAQKMKYFEDVVKDTGINTVPFAIQFLQQLKTLNVKIALATSSRNKKMKMVLKLTELERYFDLFVSGDLVQNSKPAPDIFLYAAKKLDVSPADCVVIEDAANGVKAAKNAGMKCVAITTTHTAELLEEADLVIDSYKDLNIQTLCKITD